MRRRRSIGSALLSPEFLEIVAALAGALCFLTICLQIYAMMKS